MASEFIWRKLSEQDRKELDKRVHGILDDFGKKLDSVKGSPLHRASQIGEVFVDRDVFARNEMECERDEDFRKTFFENAPKKKDDCIVAEKGEWTK